MLIKSHCKTFITRQQNREEKHLPPLISRHLLWLGCAKLHFIFHNVCLVSWSLEGHFQMDIAQLLNISVFL